MGHYLNRMKRLINHTERVHKHEGIYSKLNFGKFVSSMAVIM